MKKYLLLIILSFFVFGCSPFYITRYELVITETLPNYGPNGIGDEEYTNIPQGDTISIVSESLFPKIKKSTRARHSKRLVWITGFASKTRLISKARISRRTYRNLYRNKSNDKIASSSSAYSYKNTPSNGATIYTGSRGGRYYINSNGNKTYVKRGSSTSSAKASKSYSTKKYSTSKSSRSSKSSSYKSGPSKSRSTGTRSSYGSSSRRR
jgi:hypothetical protein